MASERRGTSVPLLPVAASLFLLPLSITFLCLHLGREAFTSFTHSLITFLRRRLASKPPTKIIITGAGSADGLAIARLLHSAGHTVIAADYEDTPYTSPARASKAVDKFFALSSDGSLVSAGANAAATDLFSTSILHIIQHEKPHLWIPCSTFPNESAVAMIKDRVENETHCKVLHPNTATLRLLTEEELFYDFVHSMDAGLQAPEARSVFSRGAIHKAMGSTKRRFVLQKQQPLKGEQLPDLSRNASRRHSRPLSFASSVSTLTVGSEVIAETVEEYTTLEALMLPSSSMSDTYNRIASIKISKSEPWMLQEIISGSQYTAHCLVVNNTMCGLVTSSLSSRQFERAMSPDMALHARISNFVDSLVRHLPQSTTTHLNVRFVLCESSTTQGLEQKLYPVSCDFHPCTASFLHGERTKTWTPQRLATIYTSAIRSTTDRTSSFESPSQSRSTAITGANIERFTSSSSLYQPYYDAVDSDFLPRTGYYSLPSSTMHFLVVPVLRFMLLQEPVEDVLEATSELLNRLAHGKEELFELRDPWPWVWKWFVAAPFTTLAGLYARSEAHEK